MTKPAHQYRRWASTLPALGHYENSGGVDADTPCIHLFSIVSNAHWFITEYDPDQALAFGLCDLGMGFPELGYVSITELEGIRSGDLQYIEVDLYWGTDDTDPPNTQPLRKGYARINRPVPEHLEFPGKEQP